MGQRDSAIARFRPPLCARGSREHEGSLRQDQGPSAATPGAFPEQKAMEDYRKDYAEELRVVGTP